MQMNKQTIRKLHFDPPRKISIIPKMFLTRLLSFKTTEAYNNDSVFGENLDKNEKANYLFVVSKRRQFIITLTEKQLCQFEFISLRIN